MRKRKNCKTLTKSEMEIMNRLWNLESGSGTIRDILSLYPNPQPAYTTIATFLKILTQKKFVRATKRKGSGKTLFFTPTISRDKYRKQAVDEVKNTFFGGSSSDLLSFFVISEELTFNDIDELNGLIYKIEERKYLDQVDEKCKYS